jgi:hypothetical protein
MCYNNMKTIERYWDKLPESDQALVETIAREAEKAPAKDKGLAIHLGAIEMLRAKGYSYRDIADWFNERGLKVNHVDVWRAHKNALEKTELFELAEGDEEWGEYLTKTVETTKGGTCTTYKDKELETGKVGTKEVADSKAGAASSRGSGKQAGRITRKKAAAR